MVSVHVSATDPSRTPSGTRQPALQALLPVGLQRENRIETSMTTPVTVSQRTGSRRQNTPVAAGHRRRARRSPGRSPGTTDFASRPGFPHDLGWGPLQIGRERVAVSDPRGSGAALTPLVNTSHVAAGAPARARLHPSYSHEPRSVVRRDPSGRGRATVLGVGPPTGGPALGRTRPGTVYPRRRLRRRRGPVAGRSCCKTEIPG